MSWPTEKLEMLTSLISSGSTPLGGARVYLEDGPVAFIRSQNVRMEGLDLSDVAHISDEIDSSMTRTRVALNDVLLNITGASIGRVSVFGCVGMRANVNQHVCIIRPKPERLDARYLAHHIATPAFQSKINAIQNGGTRQALTFSQIAEFVIPLPPLPEQKRIAVMLDKADAIRRKREQAIKLADEFLRSLFLDMFGDPVRNPKGWPRVAFADVLSIPLRNGISPSTDGTYSARILTLSAITGGFFNPYASKTALFAEPIRPEKLVDPCDFLICRGNGNLNLVGRAKFPSLLAGTAFPDTVIAARIGASCDQQYLQTLWDTGLVRQQIERGARTTNGTFKVNQQMLERLQIPLPPLPLQREFAQIAATQAHLKLRFDCSATLKFTLQSALVQRAFRGEL